jgi:23S rRNA pseudouridine1911/1915/1917 synthase
MDDPAGPDDARIAEGIRGEVKVERIATGAKRIVRFAIGRTHGRNWRLDKYLHAILPTISRSLLRRWIEQGCVTVDGAVATPRDKVAPGQAVELRQPLPPPPPEAAGRPGPVLLREDPRFLVYAKPAGMLAHQAGKILSGTLINHVQSYLEERARDPADARLVNRIDRDTSGIVLASLDLESHVALSAALEAHSLRKEYRAICHGVPEPASGSWLDPIKEAGEESIAMRIAPDGKASHTDYEVLGIAPGGRYALLRVLLRTGRQHQIRIHAAHNGHPLVGDWVYGAPCAELPGQALHSAILEFPHPRSGETIRVEAPLPPALAALWERLAAGGDVAPVPLDDDQRARLGHVAARGGPRRPAWLSEAEFAALRREAGEA